jgi:hypothetical protein
LREVKQATLTRVSQHDQPEHRLLSTGAKTLFHTEDRLRRSAALEVVVAIPKESL